MSEAARRWRRLLAAHLEGDLDAAGEAELLGILRTDPELARQAAALLQTDALLRHRQAGLEPSRFVEEVVRTVGYLDASGDLAERVEARLGGRVRRFAAAAVVLGITGWFLMTGGEAPWPENEPRLASGAALAEEASLEVPAGREVLLTYRDGSRVRAAGPAVLRRLAGEGKRLALWSGEAEWTLEEQPEGRPSRVSVGRAEAVSSGGRFRLSMTRARILEGRMRLSKEADGRAIEVPGGYETTIPAGELAPIREVEIDVDPSKRFQRIEGFGTSLNGWKPRLEELYRTPEFARLWAEDLGANILRIEVEPELLPGEVADAAAITTDRLDWSHRSPTKSGALAKALRERRGAEFRLLATVWSPPGWMKTTGRTVGTGHLREDRREHFARFVAAFCRGMESRFGVPVDAVSLRSEAEWGVRFASCAWTPAEYRDAAEALQRAFAAERLSTRLLGAELVGRSRLEPMSEAAAFARSLGDPTGGAALALQGPLGPGEDDAASWDSLRRRAGRRLWVTSAADHLPDWIGPGGALSLASEVHHALVHGGAEAYLYYQMVDDDLSVSLAGSLDSTAPKYAAFRHYSRHVRPGAVRVAASPDGSALPVAAFLHEASRTLSVVLLNVETVPLTARLALPAGASAPATWTTSADSRYAPRSLRREGGRWVLDLPPKSVATLETRLP